MCQSIHRWNVVGNASLINGCSSTIRNDGCTNSSTIQEFQFQHTTNKCWFMETPKQLTPTPRSNTLVRSAWPQHKGSAHIDSERISDSRSDEVDGEINYLLKHFKKRCRWSNFSFCVSSFPTLMIRWLCVTFSRVCKYFRSANTNTKLRPNMGSKKGPLFGPTWHPKRPQNRGFLPNGAKNGSEKWSQKEGHQNHIKFTIKLKPNQRRRVYGNGWTIWNNRQHQRHSYDWI